MDKNLPQINQAAPNTPQPAPKQPWHKPTLVYIPLQMTAEGSRTQDDGTGSSTGG